MSTPVPRTPDQTSRNVALNRSFSAAHAPNRAQPIADIGATEGVETLFSHASGKIVKFTSNAPTRPNSSGQSGTWSPGGGGGLHQPGTLPWATLTEKTMAAGPLEIYRVPGSVSFLHSGSLLHAIMPRSNCWCVDGVSKFAMRVLPDTYYRIELPGNTPEDLAKVEEFKITLQKVLFYERTACPFARTFQVDLPIEGEPKPRKKRRRTDGPAKKWKLDKAYSWKPEGWTPEQDAPSDGSSGSGTTSDEEGSSGSPEELADGLAEHVAELNVNRPAPARKPTVKDRARGIELRSVTAPPQLQAQSTPPSRLRASFLPARNDHTHTTSPSRPRGAKVPDTSAGATREELLRKDISPSLLGQPSTPARSVSQEAREPDAPPGASSEEHPSHAASDGMPILLTSATSDIEAPKSSNMSEASAEGDNVQDHRSLQSMPTDMPPSPPDSNIGLDFASSNDASSQPPISQEDALHAPQRIVHDAALAASAGPSVNVEKASQLHQNRGVAERAAARSDQLESPSVDHSTIVTGVDSTPSEPYGPVEHVDTDALFVACDARSDDLPRNRNVQREASAESDQAASLPVVDSHGDTILHDHGGDHAEPPTTPSGSALEVYGTTGVYSERPAETMPMPAAHVEPLSDTSHDIHLDRFSSSEADPFAAIQARIQARRSIGGTSITSPVPIRRRTTGLSSISTASSSSLRSHLSKRHSQEKDQAVISTALVRKTASAFLGPPVHLVAIMLRIAARFAKGAFPKVLLFESPAGMPKRVPGSFDLDDSDIEDEFGSEDEDEENEDDFGVPLRSPIRLVANENLPRTMWESHKKDRERGLVGSSEQE